MPENFESSKDLKPTHDTTKTAFAHIILVFIMVVNKVYLFALGNDTTAKIQIDYSCKTQMKSKLLPEIIEAKLYSTSTCPNYNFFLQKNYPKNQTPCSMRPCFQALQ